ncbi:MAG: class I SAM-dependent methyltransferase [Bacteroidetes bacterium]|nr:class I SAM-dependent methyltransferase [Bacteroidota bacterium]
MSQLSILFKYFNYFVSAKTKHDIHSPFVFQLLTKAIKQKTSATAFTEIEALRNSLLKNKSMITIEDFGAGSRTNNGNSRQICEIAKNQAKSPKYAQLLYRLVEYFQPENVLELGTSLGISTAYMAKAAPNAKITTIEGSESIASMAVENFKSLNIQNISIIKGNFDVQLPLMLENSDPLDFVFFDGNHRKTPTLSYFKSCLKHKNNNSVFVFDDIHWSAEMEEAWEIIKQSPEVSVSVDLFFIGLVFFRKESTKEHFIIRF